jgi:hypothetical protein
MHRLAACIAIFVSLLMPLPAGSSALFGEPLREMRQIDAEVAEPSRKAPLLEAKLASIVSGVERSGAATLGDDDVRDFYDAARTAAWYSYSAIAATTMRRAWDELDRRHIAPPGSADEMSEIYVAARLFAQARAFHRDHRDAVGVAPPAFVDLPGRSGSPTLLDVSDDGTTLHRRELRRLRGTVVVVAASPWCGFSRAMTAAVEHDPQLAGAMEKHAVWVIPQQVVRDLGSVARWNREHPSTPMSMIHRQSEWAFIASTATPAAYFFREGRLISSFSGWPGTTSEASLRAGLSAIGIDDTAGPR